jgi:hypothetical protein
LFEVIKGEVKQIVYLAELDKLVVIFGTHLVHEVLQLVFQRRPLELFKELEHPLSLRVGAARFQPEEPVEYFERGVVRE